MARIIAGCRRAGESPPRALLRYGKPALRRKIQRAASGVAGADGGAAAGDDDGSAAPDPALALSLIHI